MTFWHWILADQGKLEIAGVLLAKWTYNALPAPGQPFVLSQFIRLFLGEIVQEAPANSVKMSLTPPKDVPHA